MSLYEQYKSVENPDLDPLQEQEDDAKKKEDKDAGEDHKEELQVEKPSEQEEVPEGLEKVMIEEIKDWATELLTAAVPIANRNGKTILEAMSWIYSRYRSLHVPVHRVHTDRAREFTSKEVKRWMEARDINHTFTEGDSGEANGRAERELGILKALTRAQLVASGEKRELWPLALRHAAELRHRHQLRRLGVETPPLIPFGTIGYARRKRWERGEKGEAGLLAPMRKAKILGPAATMSLTSKGYYCRIEDSGHFIFSTAVLVPKPKSQSAFDHVHAEVQDRNPEGFEAVRDRVEARQDAGLQWLADREQEMEHHEEMSPAPFPEDQTLLPEPGNSDQPSSLPQDQALQQLEQLHTLSDEELSPSEWGEPPEEFFVHGFEADLTEEYNRLFPEDGSDPLPVRRRLWGKQTVPARLQVLNLAGGECCHDFEVNFTCEGCGLLQRRRGQRAGQGLHEGEECALRRCKFCEEPQILEENEEVEEEDWGELKVQQHWALSNLINAEIALLDGSQRDHQIWMKTVAVLQEDKEKLEGEILAQRPAEEEVLQGRTVSNQEIRDNFEDWRKPIEKELETLMGNGAIVPITKAQRDSMIQEHGTQMECIPSKIVAVIKAGGRYKARLVACGNYAVTDHITQEEKTASGADIVSLRTMIRLAAHRGWSCSSLDIKGAFLLAPRRKRNLTVLTPPKILKDKGVIPEGLLWQVDKAVYGLVESPADWGSYRDEELPLMRWKIEGETYQLKMSGEANVWKILREGDETETPQGYLATYVDDMLMVGPSPLLHGLMDVISQKWECSSKEFVEEGKDLRFCGMDIRKTSRGFDLHQSSYILDLLNRREIDKKSDFPMGKVEDLDEECPTKVDPQKLREAQQLSGELIWIATRTRMDVAYAVGAMSRRLHKDPEGALKIGQQVLEYLNQFPTLGLSYTPCEVTELDQSQVPRDINTIEIFADVSFAPGSESYRSVQGIVTALGGQVIQWHTGRQPLIATSTAEGELLSYQEAQIMGAGVEELLLEMGMRPVVIMYGDNKAAISLATLEAGSWRTRHLRIRAGKLRQTLKIGTAPGRQPWQLRHMPGTELVADGLTKALGRQAFLDFVSKTKMSESKGTVIKYLQVRGKERKTGDLLFNDREDKLDYKQMIMLAVAGLLLIVAGEVHLAAILLVLLKCLQRVKKEHLGQREMRTLPQAEPPIYPQVDLKAMRVGEPVPPLRREIEDLSDNVLRLIEFCPSGQDKWLPIQPGRWLMRSHGKHRQRCFHPLHRGCPVDSTQLEPTRFTVIFHGDGTALTRRTILRDEWNATPVPISYGEWKGYTIFKIKEEEETEEAPTRGYGGRNPAGSTATQRGRAAVPPQARSVNRPAGFQRVTTEMQQVAQGRLVPPEVLQEPLPPRPTQVRDVRPADRPSRAQASTDPPVAIQHDGSLQVRGAATYPNLVDRVASAVYVDPQDLVDSLLVSRDFVPTEIDEDDEGFELVSSSSPPKLRSLRLEPAEMTDEEDSSSSTSGTSSRLTSMSRSSSPMDLEQELSPFGPVDPPEGQRGVWDEISQVQPKSAPAASKAGPLALQPLRVSDGAFALQPEQVRVKAAPPVASVRGFPPVFTVFPPVALRTVVPVTSVIVHPSPKACAICKAKAPVPPRNTFETGP